jgi:hypothetical protein
VKRNDSIAVENNSLLLCPFCGGDAAIITIDVFCGEKEIVCCINCTAECHCVEDWNKRV